MNIKPFVLKILSLLLLLCLQASAQLSTNESPIGFKHNFSKETMPTIVMPAVDIVNLKKEDENEKRLGLPYRFGFNHPVKINLTDAGVWHTLENGDKLCRLTIASPGALSINLLYDKFWLPAGAKFFIYSQDKKHHIGAFTEINNKGTKDNIQGFATGFVSGDNIVLEYYLPKSNADKGVISISGIVHGYKPATLSRYGYGNVWIPGFGESGDCQVNINCSEGNNWQNEKRAVALIVDGDKMCSGALINNTNNNYHPYFLTAEHCLANSNGIKINTAENNPNLNNWIFYWNYELPPNSTDCNYKLTTPARPMVFSTSGAKVLANAEMQALINTYGLDFALLELTENPVQLSNYTPPFVPYYLGWDRTASVTGGIVGIHHPQGDVKKISTDNNPPSVLSITHQWGVNWKQTSNGHSVVERRSSGSPLINSSSRRIIGQLARGYDYGCAGAVHDVSFYGKFSLSWDGGGTNTTRLSNWLHPSSSTSAPNALDGIDYEVGLCSETTISRVINQNETVKCNEINVTNTTVMPNSKLTLEARVVNITDGFTVQSGASLDVRVGP